ncbi:O-antigen ligase family protein [uncultured Ruthenibacterium sp.]|uniref:O-antigen ligase family protein n=1 Tax=uncultured Ruthenibacterium sp. TaxID=1905347 RepID=UPI00349E6966
MKQIKFELTSTIFIFLLLFPHFKPRYFDEVAVLDLSFNFLRVLSAGAILVLYFTRRKINLPVLVLLIWKGWLLLTTLFNLDRGADIYTFLIRTVPDVAVFLLCSYMVVNLPNLIRALMMLGEMLIYSNLVTILLFPDGLYHTDRFFQNWLLGYRNQFFSSFLVFGLAAFLYYRYVGGWVRPAMLLAAIYASLLLVDSATSIFAISVFLFLSLVTMRFGVKMFNSVVLTCCNMIAFFLLVIFRILDMFSFIIVDMLHRNTTLTGRTILWDGLYDIIGRQPIIGYGVMGGDQTSELLNQTWATHAHNLLLQCLLEGGIVALVLFVVFNVLLIKKLYQYRGLKSAQLLSLAIFVYYIACLTEVYTVPGIYIIYAIAFAVDRIAAQEEQYLLRRRKVKFIIR